MATAAGGRAARHAGLGDVPHRSKQGGAAPGAELLTAFLARDGQEQELPALMATPEVERGTLPEVRLVGRPRVTFLEGDPSHYVGVRGTSRVVVLRAAEVRRAAARFGAFYPNALDLVIDPSWTKALMSNRRWAGGSYEATKAGGTWTFKRLQSWIT